MGCFPSRNEKSPPVAAKSVAKEESAATSEPDRDPFSKPGCYLRYHPEDHGRFELVWSRQKVQEALAYGRQTSKGIPDFKFKTGGGRILLARNIQSDRKGYHRSICEFVRECKKLECELYVMDAVEIPIPFDIYLHRSNGDVTNVRPQTFVDLKSSDAVVSLNKGSSTLQVKQITYGVFLEKGQLEGGGVDM
ncbi:MAG: uncharacterized protein KVP18_002079 [Porospora cf. gigantea A]|uniref:uncharacterized protein n=1 Tax=Porospora cf. gigantea A TaxID=2853593 RepID=UPI00355A0D9A|nr:MAG: hypothetical protein KVP18_002079 [Porospora cf. gigantea A]